LADRARDLMSAIDANGIATQAGDLANFRAATQDFVERLATLR
jgi:hypothetical protein